VKARVRISSALTQRTSKPEAAKIMARTTKLINRRVNRAASPDNSNPCHQPGNPDDAEGERKESMVGMRLALERRPGRTRRRFGLGSAPSASAVSISPTCASTSERNRFSARPVRVHRVFRDQHAADRNQRGDRRVDDAEPRHDSQWTDSRAARGWQVVDTRKRSGDALGALGRGGGLRPESWLQAAARRSSGTQASSSMSTEPTATICTRPPHQARDRRFRASRTDLSSSRHQHYRVRDDLGGPRRALAANPSSNGSVNRRLSMQHLRDRANLIGAGRPAPPITRVAMRAACAKSWGHYHAGQPPVSRMMSPIRPSTCDVASSSRRRTFGLVEQQHERRIGGARGAKRHTFGPRRQRDWPHRDRHTGTVRLWSATLRLAPSEITSPPLPRPESQRFWKTRSGKTGTLAASPSRPCGAVRAGLDQTIVDAFRATPSPQ